MGDRSCCACRWARWSADSAVPDASDAAPLTVLTGPTAAGKTDVAVDWAKRIGAEIVTADSMQVYRGLDVGTAKPGPRARAEISHHLLDVAEVEEGFSAARFQAMADQAIADIVSRGRPVLVVGGTMLYVRALLRGLHRAPPPDPDLRAEMEAMSLADLRARLAALDPESAQRVHQRDRVRLQRALEITIQSGVPASQLRAEHGFREQRYRCRLFALVPPPQVRAERIGARVDAMIAGGLIEETRWLMDRAAGAKLPALRALGYRHMAAYLRGEMPLDDAAERCKRDTRVFARRQLAWLRSEPQVRYLERPQPGVDAA